MVSLRRFPSLFPFFLSLSRGKEYNLFCLICHNSYLVFLNNDVFYRCDHVWNYRPSWYVVTGDQGHRLSSSPIPFPDLSMNSLGSPWGTSTTKGQTHTPELAALGELEFRKAFLILSYIGG